MDNMTEISRFGVSIPADLLEKFDARIEEEGYTNRSKAIADIMRDHLIASAWEEDIDEGSQPAKGGSGKGRGKKRGKGGGKDKGEGDNMEMIGIVTMVYDHHVPNLVEKLLGAQHSVGASMYSTMHIHLDHHNCLEIMALKGPPGEIKEFSDRLQAVRGVKDTKLVMTGLA